MSCSVISYDMWSYIRCKHREGSPQKRIWDYLGVFVSKCRSISWIAGEKKEKNVEGKGDQPKHPGNVARASKRSSCQVQILQTIPRHRVLAANHFHHHLLLNLKAIKMNRVNMVGKNSFTLEQDHCKFRILTDVSYFIFLVLPF